MQILSLSPLPGLCRSQPSLFTLLLSLIAKFLLPAALRVQLHSQQLQKHFKTCALELGGGR